MNSSKKTDLRQWRKWRLSGACGPESRWDELIVVGDTLFQYKCMYMDGVPHDEELYLFLAKLFRNHC